MKPIRLSMQRLPLRPMMCGLALLLAGCAPKIEAGTILKESSYLAPPYTVTEEIQHDYTDFFGDVYSRRIYRVESEGQEVVRFEGESTMWGLDVDLAASEPKVVEDWLSVFYLDQVWLWQPGQAAIAFDPFDSPEVNVWQANQMPVPAGWDGDYHATNFQIVENQWILEYSVAWPLADAPNPGPKHFYFVSKDQGKTFVPVVNEATIPTGTFEAG